MNAKPLSEKPQWRGRVKHRSKRGLGRTEFDQILMTLLTHILGPAIALEKWRS
jgi:hypothetical protein